MDSRFGLGEARCAGLAKFHAKFMGLAHIRSVSVRGARSFRFFGSGFGSGSGFRPRSGLGRSLNLGAGPGFQLVPSCLGQVGVVLIIRV